jgi:hypothetical protein
VPGARHSAPPASFAAIIGDAGQSADQSMRRRSPGPRRARSRGRSLRWRAVARILIVGGGCRGRRLAVELVQRGHALRVTTRGDGGRAAIEATGAQCWIGTPDRLATLRGALDSVTIACWMLTGARGDAEQIAALHGSRLEFFLSQAIDTTVRGFVYDAWPAQGGVGADALAGGSRIVGRLAQLNAIPARVLGAPQGGGAEVEADGDAAAAWIAAAGAAIDALLGSG